MCLKLDVCMENLGPSPLILFGGYHIGHLRAESHTTITVVCVCSRQVTPPGLALIWGFFCLWVPEFLLSQETKLPRFSFSTSFQNWLLFAYMEHETACSLYIDQAPLIWLCLQLTHSRGWVSNPKIHFTVSLTIEASQRDATFGTVGSFALFQLVTLGPFP